MFERLHIPSLDGATEWLNSEPLGPAGLRGHVVVVNFWTLTCINWLRQEPYVRAWSQAYRDDGLVVIGVHTPEFSFEHDIDHVRRATKERAIDYPVAVDNDYAIWNAFDNHYWPALYFVDTRRPHPRRALRRRTLRTVRAHHPAAARRRPRPRPRRRAAAWRRTPTGTICARPRRISATRAANSSRRPTRCSSTNAAATTSPPACPPTTGPSPAPGRSDARTSSSSEAGGSIACPIPGSRRPPRARHADSASRSRSACCSTAKPRAAHTAWMSTRTATALLDDSRLYQLVRAHDAVRQRTLHDHLPRARRRGLLVHVRIAAHGLGTEQQQRQGQHTERGARAAAHANRVVAGVRRRTAAHQLLGRVGRDAGRAPAAGALLAVLPGAGAHRKRHRDHVEGDGDPGDVRTAGEQRRLRADDELQDRDPRVRRHPGALPAPRSARAWWRTLALWTPVRHGGPAC